MRYKTKMKEWKEVKNQIFAFTEVGQMVIGKYIKTEKSKKYDNDVYHIKTMDNEIFVVFGTAILSDKMKNVPLGSEVKIELVGFEESKKTGQQDLKVFNVFYR